MYENVEICHLVSLGEGKYTRPETVSYTHLLVLVIFVSVIQYIGTFIEKKNIH